jgi:superfamily I DNA/RNA helicase
VNLTDEQRSIIETTGDVAVNAVAGSGKTTTLIEYARSRPAGSRMLYIAFNRSVKAEAERKFTQNGLKFVEVETMHSLAYRFAVRGKAYQVRHDGDYRPHELCGLLGLLPVSADAHSEVVLATHIQKYAAFFCNQAAEKVQDVDYRHSLTDAAALAFADQHYGEILAGTRRFLALMDKGECAITHDFYLKKFQLQQLFLGYTHILFDEAQDASPVMLDILMRQRPATTCVMVGDTHQQIYGWRYAVNALETVDFPRYTLTTSFRFNEAVAFVAMQCLRWKRHLLPAFGGAQIVGAGGTPTGSSRAVLARTNLRLLQSAIDLMESGDAKRLYFEGNLSSYTYAAEGASIYDVLNLFQEKTKSVHHPLIRQMADFEELEHYAECADDKELGMLIDMVKAYKAELPALLQRLRDQHLPDGDRHKADIIFSTVHRCKGLEYDEVALEDDFLCESDVQQLLAATETHTDQSRARLVEEINLLYVAATRTRDRLWLPTKYAPQLTTVRLL